MTNSDAELIETAERWLAVSRSVARDDPPFEAVLIAQLLAALRKASQK